MSQNVKEKALKSSKWVVITDIITKVSTPIMSIALAKILAPEAYGLVATAVLIISFAQMFWDAGLSKTLIQDDAINEDSKNAVFILNILFSAILYTLIWILSPVYGILFKSYESIPIIRIMSIGIIISAFGSVHSTLLVRNLDFKLLLPIKISNATLPSIIAIPLAIKGFGAYAIVLGSLFSQVLNLFLIMMLSSWKPIFKIDIKEIKRLLKLSKWYFSESLSAWFFAWGDSLFLGISLGITELGVYRTGAQMVNFFFAIILSPFITLLFPTFSRMQGDKKALYTSFRNVNKIVMLIVCPVAVCFAFLGEPVTQIIFGHKWAGIGAVVSYLGVMVSISWVVGLNAELYRAIGRPDVSTKLQIFSIFYYLPAYYIAGKFGVHIFLVVRVLLAISMIPIHVLLCHKFLYFPLLYLWHDGKWIFLSGIIMTSVYILFINFLMNLMNFWVGSVIILSIGFLIFGYCIRIFDYSLFFNVKKFVYKIIK